MSDMKCPFCGKEMICGGTICRYNPDCPIHDTPVPTEVLELLDRTRKALDVAVDALKDNLSQANFTQMLDASRFHCIRTKCESALAEITALEQKD